MDDSGSNTIKPTPDPTVLTTAALQREVNAATQVDEIRQEALDRELALRQQAREREVSELKSSFTSGRKSDWRLFKAELKVLHEKFKSQDRVLNLMEEQRKERKEDDRRALDAALAAAEKARVADTEASDRANTKTELSTAEQLKQQNTTSQQANANTITLLNTLQTRVERIENIKQGAQEVTTEKRANTGLIWAVVGVGASLFFGFNTLLIGAITIFMMTRQ